MKKKIFKKYTYVRRNVIGSMQVSGDAQLI